MEMTIDEAITRYKNNAEYERTHGNLQGCLDFKQLAEWLEKLQKIEQIVKQYKKFGNIDFSMQIICGVVEDGNDD